MSAAYGMVKFKSTGNIYMCCYEGTSDIMIPFIFKPNECIDEEGCYRAISYGRKLCDGYKRSWEFPVVDDLDECEIYSDYGGGFYWNGTGSESAMMLKEPINFGEDVPYGKYTNGKPEWVTEFWRKVK